MVQYNKVMRGGGGKIKLKLFSIVMNRKSKSFFKNKT